MQKSGLWIHFSAHGDRDEMFEFIENQRGLKKALLVHGEYETQLEFKEFLNAKGFHDIEIPAPGDEFEGTLTRKQNVINAFFSIFSSIKNEIFVINLEYV